MPTKIPKTTIEKIIEMHLQKNMTYRHISTIISISPATVHNYIKEYEKNPEIFIQKYEIQRYKIEIKK